MSETKARTIRMELQLDASPEAVWEALTTPEGIQSWFAPEVRVQPGEGGSVWISWGPGMEGESTIGAWEPNRRYSYFQQHPGRDPMVVEFIIEGQEGSTVLRLVQSGFGADASFDDEIESTSHAWRLFLHMLKHGVEHRHSASRNVTVFRFIGRPRNELWRELREAPGHGVTSFDDCAGCRAVEYPELNNSITGIFCEKCGGQTGVTLMSVLYDQAPEIEERVRREWTSIADALTTSHGSQDHP